MPASGSDQVVVGIEDDRPLWLGHPRDHRLHLGQLGQRVQALQVQMVAADVGQHARVVRLVAKAAQQDSAARRFEHSQVHVRSPEDGVGTLWPGEVARLDHALVHDHAIGGGHAHVAAGQQRDVGNHARRGALAVGAAHADHGHAAVLVGDHHRDAAVRGRRHAARSALGHGCVSAAVLFQTQCGPCDRLAFALVHPWVGNDPVAGFAGAMDGDAHASTETLAVQPAHVIRQLDDGARRLAPGNGLSQADQGVLAGQAIAVPRPAPANGHLDPNGRLQQVQIWPVKQANFDQSHSRGSIGAARGGERSRKVRR